VRRWKRATIFGVKKKRLEPPPYYPDGREQEKNQHRENRTRYKTKNLLEQSVGKRIKWGGVTHIFEDRRPGERQEWTGQGNSRAKQLGEVGGQLKRKGKK